MTIPEAAPAQGEIAERQLGELFLQANSLGAYLERFDYGGVPLLVPYFVNQYGKKRGGIFAPIPYFGAGGAFAEYGLTAQHGFTREEVWKQAIDSRPGFLKYEFSANQRHGRFEGLHSMVTYQALMTEVGPSLITKLIFVNDRMEALPVAPGLHYYFPKIDNDGVVQVRTVSNGGYQRAHDFNLSALRQAEEIGRDIKQIQFASGDWNVTMINSDNLTVPIIWSDDPSMGCVEPSRTGIIPSSQDIPGRNIMLQPGGIIEFSSQLIWSHIPETAAGMRSVPEHERASRAQ